MVDQEFLASFGVDIDESGVSRLQQILTENRTLAESLSKSFEAASESVKAFKAQVTTDLPSLFSGNGYGNVTENLFGSLGGLKIGRKMGTMLAGKASILGGVILIAIGLEIFISNSF